MNCFQFTVSNVQYIIHFNDVTKSIQFSHRRLYQLMSISKLTEHQFITAKGNFSHFEQLLCIVNDIKWGVCQILIIQHNDIWLHQITWIRIIQCKYAHSPFNTTYCYIYITYYIDAKEKLKERGNEEEEKKRVEHMRTKRFYHQ